ENSPVYSVVAIENGSSEWVSETLLKFTPANGFTGLASVSVKVTDLQGASHVVQWGIRVHP
ncbi:MAG: Ig-like domain-containing protein, partial [Puniceicoccaceae bacterium]